MTRNIYLSICLGLGKICSWENLECCYRKGKRDRKTELGEEGEKKQTERGKVHPVDGGPAPLVFLRGGDAA